VSPSVVWTGEELVVWGGETESEAAWTDTGAAYDPDARAWRDLAESPLSPRSAHIAVWSGTEVLVCCGRAPDGDGNRAAAYNPERDSWRSIADPPFEAEAAVAVWTGTQMIVAGGIANGEAFAYQPSSDTWRQLTSPPREIAGGADVAWTGELMVVWPGLSGTTPGMTYDPTNDQWSDLPPLRPELDVYGGSMVWTGSEIIVWGNSRRTDSDAVGARLALDANSWAAIANDPLEPFDWWEGIPGTNSAVWTGTEMLVWAGAMGDPVLTADDARTRVLAYNPASDSWRDLGDAPTDGHGPDLVWTGQVAVALTDPIVAARPGAGP
jgi:N-acetylneuraminic acid mutarotase